jgi:predicted nucleic acid-binding protein
MYLLDTNVVSELRKRRRGNAGVHQFFHSYRDGPRVSVFFSVITVGELRRGVELIRYRGDIPRARRLER